MLGIRLFLANVLPMKCLVEGSSFLTDSKKNITVNSNALIHSFQFCSFYSSKPGHIVDFFTASRTIFAFLRL